jgi:ribosome-binding protein aMBF1 (putative translation factor)
MSRHDGGGANGTLRAISVSETVYERIRAEARRRGISIRELADEMLATLPGEAKS